MLTAEVEHQMDRLTRACTSFVCWREFLWHMGKGYVPTIYPVSRRARILRRILLATHLRVWPRLPGERPWREYDFRYGGN